VNYIKSVVLQL